MAVSPILLCPGQDASWRRNRAQYLPVWESFISREPEALCAVRTLPYFLFYRVLLPPLTSWGTLGKLLHSPGPQFPHLQNKAARLNHFQVNSYPTKVHTKSISLSFLKIQSWVATPKGDWLTNEQFNERVISL